MPDINHMTTSDAATARDAAANKPLASWTQSKTIGTAKAAHKRFERMENEVQQALAVMEKKLANMKLLPTNETPKVQKSVEHIRSQRIWMTSARSWRTNKRHQHHILHSLTQGPQRKNEGQEIWTVCMQ